MPRILHGGVIRVDNLEIAAHVLGGETEAFQDLMAFDFMFPDLQNSDANLLPVTDSTVANLKTLGRTMRDPGDSPAGVPSNSSLPAILTYFGQFIDHDITLEGVSSAQLNELLIANLQPLSVDSARATVRNLRTATLDLDNVYGPPAPRNGELLRVGTVSTNRLDGSVIGRRPQGKGADNDVPREPQSVIVSHDRAALIGDPRNDENLIVSQLHVAFLRAHNAIVASGKTFEEARTLLRQHYQHIVLNEYLPAIADPAIVSGILQNGNRFFNPPDNAFFMPLEFSFAAFRFGHSMVRDAYDFNFNFGPTGALGPATLAFLFTFTALSGQLGNDQLGESLTLPENWIIEWERFVGNTNSNLARPIDTKLVEPLFALQNLEGVPGDDDTSNDASNNASDGARLAVRNLLRGYLIRMPTGQAVATAIGQVPLTAQNIKDAAVSQQQVSALEAGDFAVRTPLWYYILAEARHAGNGGNRLGPVGSTIVAEVLTGLIRRSADSILTQPNWTPSLRSETEGTFTLADLLRLAGVLS